MSGRFRTAFRTSFRALHQLTLQVLGTLFLAFGVVLGAEALRQFRLYTSDEVSLGWVLLSVLFSLLMLVFAAQSFWKARGLSK
jgi:TRAP-type C4-dicarboxylate transport system permease small subunit